MHFSLFLILFKKIKYIHRGLKNLFLMSGCILATFVISLILSFLSGSKISQTKSEESNIDNEAEPAVEII